MKIVNRGYMLVKPKQAFLDWANSCDEDYNDLQEAEPNIYLIEEEFYEDEPIIKANFKKIFKNELLAVTEDESKYPEVKERLFFEWFHVELGSMVFDTLDSNIIAD